MKYRDLRDFIDQLEGRAQLRKVPDPVSPVLEMTAIGDKLLRANGPAVLFTRPVGYKIPVVINLFGTPDRVALGMGASSAKDLREVGRLISFELWTGSAHGVSGDFASDETPRRLLAKAGVRQVSALGITSPEASAEGFERLTSVAERVGALA